MSLITNKGQWKKVQLPESSSDNAAFDFLGSFEELSSYTILRKSKKSNGSEAGTPLPTKRNKNSKPNTKSVDSGGESSSRSASKLTDNHYQDRKKRKLTKTEENSAVASCASSVNGDVCMDGWSGLFVPDEILSALTKLGFTEPTPIQRLVLPSAIRDRLDIVGAAETGSGKTLGFAIPILARLLENFKNSDVDAAKTNNPNWLKALILTPTRELAIQVKCHVAALLTFTTFQVSAIVGGLSIEKQRRILKKKPAIIVATPGRLWELLQEEMGTAIDVSQVPFLVIDEADRMIEKGHFEELHDILNLLNSENEQFARRRQTFVFSATLTFVHPPPFRLFTKQDVQQLTSKEKIDALIAMLRIRKKHAVLDVTRKLGTAEKLTEARINCSGLSDKDAKLYYFLHQFPDRTVVFTNSIDAARRLSSILSRLQLPVHLLHAKMQQRQRLKNLDRFSTSEKAILLATDVASRGLDIKGIRNVVHYQVPRTAEIYIHRSGRTARAQSDGMAVMLVDPKDARFYRKICGSLNKDDELPVFPIDAYQFEQLKKRVAVAVELESMEHQCKRLKAKRSWFQRAAEEIDVDLEDDELEKNIGQSEILTEKSKRIDALARQLQKLLRVPLANNTKRFTTKYPTFQDATDQEKLGQLPSNSLELMKLEGTLLAKNKKQRLNLRGKLKIKKKRKH